VVEGLHGGTAARAVPERPDGVSGATSLATRRNGRALGLAVARGRERVAQLAVVDRLDSVARAGPVSLADDPMAIPAAVADPSHAVTGTLVSVAEPGNT
jgi:hypothetical protein